MYRNETERLRARYGGNEKVNEALDIIRRGREPFAPPVIEARLGKEKRLAIINAVKIIKKAGANGVLLALDDDEIWEPGGHEKIDDLLFILKNSAGFAWYIKRLEDFEIEIIF